MIDAVQREKAFREDFEALLKKHGAEFILTDDGRPYGMHGPVARISMDGVWADDKYEKEFCEFELDGFLG